MVEAQSKSSGRRGGSRRANGENVRFPFLQNEDGSEVDGAVLNDMTFHSHRIWNDSVSTDGSPPALNWKGLSQPVLNTYVCSMEAHFPQFRLCHNRWKIGVYGKSSFRDWFKAKFGAVKNMKGAGVANMKVEKLEPGLSGDTVAPREFAKMDDFLADGLKQLPELLPWYRTIIR